ncbi:zinc ribbon domain-containing protein [Sporolactobacillus shoreae]|uniref:zinc ribbon domain-containing protein n=1 Tax=Sporolactobacillus shoreae TaxID=1465501 RepID=UPI0019D5B001|nr:zinc ribbon domain-containing protein [Sporolactobacillus shoreae]
MILSLSAKKRFKFIKGCQRRKLELRRQLIYKCAWYGKELKLVNPYKTSQLCSMCGYDDGKKPLNVREWTCPQCGTHHDRDVNAASNIKQLAFGR